MQELRSAYFKPALKKREKKEHKKFVQRKMKNEWFWIKV